MIVKNCLCCGKSFLARAHTTKYCSAECGDRYRAAHCNSVESKLERGFTYRTCNVCGKSFLAKSPKITTCSSCQRREYERGLITQKKKRKVPVSLSDMEKEARRLGVSYGQLVAMKEGRV